MKQLPCLAVIVTLFVAMGCSTDRPVNTNVIYDASVKELYEMYPAITESRSGFSSRNGIYGDSLDIYFSMDVDSLMASRSKDDTAINDVEAAILRFVEVYGVETYRNTIKFAREYIAAGAHSATVAEVVNTSVNVPNHIAAGVAYNIDKHISSGRIIDAVGGEPKPYNPGESINHWDLCDWELVAAYGEAVADVFIAILEGGETDGASLILDLADGVSGYFDYEEVMKNYKECKNPDRIYN